MMIQAKEMTQTLDTDPKRLSLTKVESLNLFAEISPTLLLTPTHNSNKKKKTAVLKRQTNPCTYTLPNVKAKVSMDVCISPNIAVLFSGFTSLKLTPAESDKAHKSVSQNKTVLQTSLCTLNLSTKVFTRLGLRVGGR